MIHRKVRWAASASLDLVGIVEYISPDRPDAAARLAGRILDATETSSRHPLEGRIVPELTGIGVSEYRQLLVDAYRIVYRVRDETIGILAVVDSRRDLTSLLMERLLRP